MAERRYGLIAGMIAAAALSRFLPHPPNMLPITAMALFAGAKLSSRTAAFFTVGAAMLISDCFLGAHATMPLVYGALALIICIGAMYGRYESRNSAASSSRSTNHSTLLPLAGAALSSSLLFFFVSNLGVWLFQDLYPRSVAGLLACYTAAIPFFENSLIADGFYTAVLFGAYALLEGYTMQKTPAQATLRRP